MSRGPHLRKGLDGTVAMWVLMPFTIVFELIGDVCYGIAWLLDRRR